MTVRNIPVYAVNTNNIKWNMTLCCVLVVTEIWSVSRWAVVTGAGACVVEAGAAPDLLRALLRDCRGPDAHPVKDFFQVSSYYVTCNRSMEHVALGRDDVSKSWYPRYKQRVQLS